MAQLFLLEDDVQLGASLGRVLGQAGFRVHWRRHAVNACEVLMRGSFAVGILDVQLPDGSGFDVLRALRQRDSKIPVLMLTVRDAVADRVRGLDGGADDYVLKPCSPAELISRVHALIRRSAGQAATLWRVGPLQLEPLQHRASMDGQPLNFSPTEYQLLLELVREAGRVVARASLEAAVLRSPEGSDSNLLDVHIFNLRRKIGKHVIRTIRGVGYMLDL